MSSWAIVALVAIVIWGIVESIRARAGIITDEDGNQKIAQGEDRAAAIELETARAELAELRATAGPLEGCEAEAAVLAKAPWSAGGPAPGEPRNHQVRGHHGRDGIPCG